MGDGVEERDECFIAERRVRSAILLDCYLLPDCFLVDISFDLTKHRLIPSAPLLQHPCPLLPARPPSPPSPSLYQKRRGSMSHNKLMRRNQGCLPQRPRRILSLAWNPRPPPRAQVQLHPCPRQEVGRHSGHPPTTHTTSTTQRPTKPRG